MDLDQGVKMEAPENETPSCAEALPPNKNVTLALTCQTSASKNTLPSPPQPITSPSSKVKNLKVKGGKFIIKKRRCGSKVKHELSEITTEWVSSKRRKSATGASSTPDGAMSSALIRAVELQSSLELEFPSFVKSMVRSHVGSCFWLGLPGPFCKSHLPRIETTVILEDEGGGIFPVKYIADRTGLSAGWRQFCGKNKLLEGDVLVFQLVEPCKFKVYIIRANDMAEVDGALVLLNLDSQTKQNDPETGQSTKKQRKSLPLTVLQKKNKKKAPRKLVLRLRNPTEQSENDSENVSSEVVEGSRPPVHFKDIISYKNFSILVNGLLVDSELSEDTKTKYYNLCSSQNAFLHEHITKGYSPKLIAGVISETVSIAEAIKTCTLTTPRDEFETWAKTLKAFEILGMNVDFLHTRIHRLVSLAFESESAVDRKNYVEAKTERDRTAEEIKTLEEKLVDLKRVSERFGADIESLKSKAEKYEVKFQEEAAAPW